MHCWVCDEKARELSNEAQSAIVSYFELVFDNQQKVELGSGGGLLHPLLRKSYDVLLPGFVDQIPTTRRHEGLEEMCR